MGGKLGTMQIQFLDMEVRRPCRIKARVPIDHVASARQLLTAFILPTCRRVQDELVSLEDCHDLKAVESAGSLHVQCTTIAGDRVADTRSDVGSSVPMLRGATLD